MLPLEPKGRCFTDTPASLTDYLPILPALQLWRLPLIMGWLNPPPQRNSLEFPSLRTRWCLKYTSSNGFYIAVNFCKTVLIFLLGDLSSLQGTLSVHISILLEVTYYSHTYFDFRGRTSVSSDFNLPNRKE